MADALLSGVLPAIYSFGDRAKRQLKDLLSNPSGVVQQASGQLIDNQKQIADLHNQAFGDPRNPLKITNRQAFNELADKATNSMMDMNAGVIKPKGGNWLTGSVEKGLQDLKHSDFLKNIEYYHGPEFEKAREARIKELKERGKEPFLEIAKILEEKIEPDKAKGAINQWIDKNLTNYIKKEMGTPEDPVRKLAEQGILHYPFEPHQTSVSETLFDKRLKYGQNPTGLGKSNEARSWERYSDEAINPYPASAYKKSFDQDILKKNPWIEKLSDDALIYDTKKSIQRFGVGTYHGCTQARLRKWSPAP